MNEINVSVRFWCDFQMISNHDYAIEIIKVNYFFLKYKTVAISQSHNDVRDDFRVSTNI